MTGTINLTDQQLIALVGKGAFGRGKDYFQQGTVLSWKKKGSVITAQVDGSRWYHVKLTHNSKRFEGYCDCLASEGYQDLVALRTRYKAKRNFIQYLKDAFGSVAND